MKKIAVLVMVSLLCMSCAHVPKSEELDLKVNCLARIGLPCKHRAFVLYTNVEGYILAVPKHGTKDLIDITILNGRVQISVGKSLFESVPPHTEWILIKPSGSRVTLSINSVGYDICEAVFNHFTWKEGSGKGGVK